MSKTKYLHHVLNKSVKDDDATTYEEMIVEGPKGIMVKLYTKDKNNVEKIVIRGTGNNFEMTTQNGEDKNLKSLSKEEMLDEFKKNKKLKFAAEFIKTQKGGSWLSRSKRKTASGKKRSTGTKKKSSAAKPKKVAKRKSTGSRK